MQRATEAVWDALCHDCPKEERGVCPGAIKGCMERKKGLIDQEFAKSYMSQG